jgi:hypothetical protein
VDAAEVRQQFDATGVVRLDAAFTPEEAAAMRSVAWRYAERKAAGLRIDDPTTWPQGQPPLSWKGLKGNRAFAPLTRNHAVSGALDAIFGVGGWIPPRPGAQMLVTFPSPGPWTLPDGWHMDCGFEQPTWPVFAVKLFAFFGDVGPEGGGTMLLPGSHRLVDRYRKGLPPGTGAGATNWRPFMRQDPWLAQLLEGANQPDGGRSLVGRSHDIDGLPVEVVELTGRQGDVIIAHLHVFHSASPNTGQHPRQMLGKGIAASTKPPDRI